MLRKNKGSILIVTVFVFLLVNIIAISCSALIFSNNKYAKYNYEEAYIEEQCLSKIELVYSNVLKEVELALDKSDDYNSFENYFTENNSYDFINRISDISDASLKDTQCSVDKIDYYDVPNTIYYRVLSKVEYKSFNKTMVAYIKIKNPFLKDSDVEQTDEIEIIELEESEINEATDKDSQKINNQQEKSQVKPSDIVVLFDCKEV